MKKTIVLLVLLTLTSAFSQVKEYYITCNPDDFAKIYKTPREDIYINASLKYLDKEWDNLSLRIRGDDTRVLPKKSLKIKFEEEPFADGKTTLNFNAEYEDESYINQYLSSIAFKRAGYTCYQTEHARLYLNGKYLGLYLRVENIDEQFLEANALDTKANLYKATEDDACLSIYEDIDSLWEKKSNEGAPWDDLFALRDSLFYVSDYDYYEFAKRTFDYDKMVDVLALNFLVAHGSTYYHNYFMFHDINKSGKWWMLPWDMDKTFFKYGYLYTYHRSSSYNSHDNPFMERAIICDPIYNDIKSRIDYFANDFFNSKFFDPIIDSLANLIRTSVEQDTTDSMTDISVWEGRIEKNKEFVKERYNNLKWQFSALPRSFRVEPTFGTKFLPYKFVWHPSKNPDGTAPKYKFYIGKQKNLEELAEFSVKDLTDTTFTLTTLADTGLYYWKVMAYNSAGSLDGFDYPNLITINEPTSLPCEITTNTTLTKEKSPYTVNCDVEVSPNVNLVIEKGVEIVFSGYYQIQIRGSLKVNGTKEEPVKFTHDQNTNLWNSIYFHYATSPCIINHAIINNGTIYSQNSKLSFESMTMNFTYQDTAYAIPLMYLDKTQARMNNSIIKSNGIRQGFIIYYADSSSCENSYFDNVPDAIEFTKSKDGLISNNEIHNSTDDCIDLNGCNNVLIKNNKIFNAIDKGISLGNENVGYCENITVQNNLITGCESGIVVKDSSKILILNNTLYNNKISIDCFEKRSPQGGGFATLINNIFANDSICIRLDSKSQADISYCLSDDEDLNGIGNIKIDPLFVDRNNLNFNLISGSPCIDAGDPNSSLDPDGTRADLGALYFNQAKPKIVINEINYNSFPDTDSDDWVELYNNEDFDVDISNWVFKDSDDSHGYSMPDNTIIKADDFVVICTDSLKFKKVYKNVSNIYGNTGFGLSGAGEMIRLYDNYNKLIDFVEYDDISPWDELADGKGHSLELINPNFDNTLAENWKASKSTGTPKRNNENLINDISALRYSADLVQFELFPNPVISKANLLITLLEDADVKIDLYDLLGNQLEHIFDGNLTAGEHGVDINMSKYSSGNYIVSLQVANLLFSQRVVNIKEESK